MLLHRAACAYFFNLYCLYAAGVHFAVPASGGNSKLSIACAAGVATSLRGLRHLLRLSCIAPCTQLEGNPVVTEAGARGPLTAALAAALPYLRHVDADLDDDSEGADDDDADGGSDEGDGAAGGAAESSGTGGPGGDGSAAADAAARPQASNALRLDALLDALDSMERAALERTGRLTAGYAAAHAERRQQSSARASALGLPPADAGAALRPPSAQRPSTTAASPAAGKLGLLALARRGRCFHR